MGDFFGLSIGVSSLFAHRQALETAGSNIANANTDGYSRQRVTLVQAGGQAVPAIHARSTSSNTGVMASGAQRMRDMFLESRSSAEHGTESSLGQTKLMLDRMEGIFSEPSDNGLGAQLADFWAGWEDLANNPGDLAARSQLLQRANTVVNGLNQAEKDLSNLWNSSVAQLGTIVTGMNAAADRMAELNGAILRATSDGLNANSLMDQRDQLVQQLAQAGGITTNLRENGTMDVFLSGTALVRGDVSSHLQVAVPAPPTVASPTDVTNADQPGQAVQLTWVKDGYPAVVGNGEAGGLLDGLNRMMPQYRAGVDAIAHQLADAVNAQHNRGIDLNGAQAGSASGLAVGGLTVTGANNTFTVAVGAGGPATVTLTNAVYAADAAGAAALKSDLQAQLDGIPGGPGQVLADVRVVGADLQVVLTGGTPGQTFTFGTGPTNVLSNLGIANGATASTDSFFSFTPLTGVMRLTIGDPRLVAAANPGSGQLDGGNALNISNIGTFVGGPDDSYRNFIIGLGVETQATTRRVDIQHSIVTQLDTQRDAAAGVSLDEEMANLMMYQRGYEAAARLITTVDGLLETLIHGTGLVGR